MVLLRWCSRRFPAAAARFAVAMLVVIAIAVARVVAGLAMPGSCVGCSSGGIAGCGLFFARVRFRARLAATSWCWCSAARAALFWLLVAPFWVAALADARASASLAPAGLLLVGAWMALVELQARSPWLVLAAMAIVWIADTAAYFAGRAFGSAASSRRGSAPARHGKVSTARLRPCGLRAGTGARCARGLRCTGLSAACHRSSGSAFALCWRACRSSAICSNRC